jgi:hypothetical protein
VPRATGVTALMSILPVALGPPSLSAQVKGRAWRHRLIRTAGMSTLVAPPGSLEPPRRCLMSLTALLVKSMKSEQILGPRVSNQREARAVVVLSPS